MCSQRLTRAGVEIQRSDKGFNKGLPWAGAEIYYSQSLTRAGAQIQRPDKGFSKGLPWAGAEILQTKSDKGWSRDTKV